MTRRNGSLLALAFLAGCPRTIVCPADELACGETCVAIRQDPANCGACGRACPAGEACRAGSCTECAAACGGGQTCRNGLCVADAYVACYNLNEVRGTTLSLADAGLPAATDSGPLALAWVGTTLYAANSTSNTLTALRLEPPPATASRAVTLHAAGGYDDLEYLAADGGLLYVSNASVGTVVIVDPASGPVDEVALAASSGTYVGPAGIAFVPAAGSKPRRAYVALNATSEIAVLDVGGVASCGSDPAPPPCGPGGSCPAGTACVDGTGCRAPCARLAGRIAIPAAFASPGGAPMPARLLAGGSRLYATLWNLDPATYAPAGSGRLAVVDTATDELAGDAVDLGPDCLDPSGLALEGSTLWVTCGWYDFFGTKTVQGGAFVPVDVGGIAPVVKPAVKVTWAPGEIAFCRGVGLAGDRASGSVLAFDPVAGAVTASRDICPASAGLASFVSAVACAP